MKRCPHCNNLFDDINDFCLNDGTPLTAAIQIDYASQETPTVAAQRQQQPIGSGRIKWILPILLLSALLIAAVGVIGFLLVTRNNTEANKANSQQNVAVVNKSTPTPKPTETATKTPTPTPKEDYPATTRLKFNKGAVTTKYDGDINANDSRSFVLACAAGQELSAVVASDDDCVEFKQGGDSYDTVTSKGDNIVTIKNTCSNKTTFRIEISVL
jgi:cytoskeletal protein RodZ